MLLTDCFCIRTIFRIWSRPTLVSGNLIKSQTACGAMASINLHCNTEYILGARRLMQAPHPLGFSQQISSRRQEESPARWQGRHSSTGGKADRGMLTQRRS